MPETPSALDRLLRVFLCHSSGDKPAVRELCHRLREDGFDPWFDEQNLLPGQNWQEEIQKSVQRCDVFAVCLSRASVAKEGSVQKEIHDALEIANEKPEGTIFIIPIKLDECEIPRRLRRLHWADLFAAGGYERLVLALRERARNIGLLVSSESQPEPPLRSERATLSLDEAKIMVATRDFYHSTWNAGGKGSRHLFQTKVLHKALVVVDQATGLAWQKGGSGNVVPGGFQGAEQYVRNLDTQQFAGFEDWRLPTLEEAMSLMTPDAGGRSGEASADQPGAGAMHLDRIFERAGAPFIWTSDPASATHAWVVYYLDGQCWRESVDFNAYVRAVRSL